MQYAITQYFKTWQLILGNRAAEKPLLILSMYFENSKDKDGREKDAKYAITQVLIRATEYAKDNCMQLLIGADVNAWSCQ